jgi:hypothetical protein
MLTHGRSTPKILQNRMSCGLNVCTGAEDDMAPTDDTVRVSGTTLYTQWSGWELLLFQVYGAGDRMYCTYTRHVLESITPTVRDMEVLVKTRETF